MPLHSPRSGAPLARPLERPTPIQLSESCLNPSMTLLADGLLYLAAALLWLRHQVLAEVQVRRNPRALESAATLR